MCSTCTRAKVLDSRGNRKEVGHSTRSISENTDFGESPPIGSEVHVCVCVWVCVRERDSERERESVCE